MSDSKIDVMESTLKNMNLSSGGSTTFDFASLPYRFQKRFVEVCDPATLKTFARINADTRNLAKRCHAVERVEIKDDGCKCILSCYCTMNEVCNGVSASSIKTFKKKIQVMNMLKISKSKETIDAYFLENLPFAFNSIKHLELVIGNIDFDLLKSLFNPGLKEFTFCGGIESDCPFVDFLGFVCGLLKLDKFFFVLIRSTCALSFNIDDIFQRGQVLKALNHIDECVRDDVSIALEKNN